MDKDEVFPQHAPFSRFRTSGWDNSSLLLIGFFAVLQFCQWLAAPRFLDMYYHLAVASGFAEAGGYVTRAFWEAAPVGRPHLYPPLLHVVILLLFKLGLGPIAAGRLLDCAMQPLLLVCVWATCRAVHGARPAFFVLLVWSSVYSLSVVTATNPAFSLALAMGLGMFAAVERRKALPAAVLLGMSFYTHAGAPWLCLAAILLYGVLNRNLRRCILTAAGLGLLIGLPFFLHLAANRGYFGWVQVRENRQIPVDVLVYLLAAAGAAVAARRKGPYLFPLCLLVAMLPMALNFPLRFVAGHGIAGAAWLAGLALEAAYARARARPRANVFGPAVLVLGAVCFLVAAPTLHVNRRNHTARWQFADRTLTHLILPQAPDSARPKESTIYFPDEYGKITEIVRAYSGKDDIIWSDFSYGGGLIALLAGRRTSTAMLPEVRPYEKFDGVRAARLAIWFKTADGGEPDDMLQTCERVGLRKVGETGLVHVYLNPLAQPSGKAGNPVVPTPVLFAILLVSASLIISGGISNDGNKK